MKIERTKNEERKKNIVHLLIALFNNTITCIADKIQMILYYILLQYPMQNSILFLFCSMSLTYIKFFTMMQNIYEILKRHLHMQMQMKLKSKLRLVFSSSVCECLCAIQVKIKRYPTNMRQQ